MNKVKPVFLDDIVEAPPAAPAGSIGDINSDEKGSGARYNAGKPPLDLIPLSILSVSYGVKYGFTPAVEALNLLGQFQSTHDEDFLYQVLQTLGMDGWHECAHVFDYGRHKYKAWNWAKGMDWTIPLACAARHLEKIIIGQEMDDESKLPHRGHVVCNIVMLLAYVEVYPEGNDLPPVGLLP